MDQFVGLEYAQRREILPGIELSLHDAGHILGAAIVELSLEDGGEHRTLVFSGDLGYAAAPVMNDPTPMFEADLARLRLLHDRDPQTAWETWRQAFGPSVLDVQSGPRFASTDLLLRAAAQGQGVALARHHLAADDIASNHLIRPFSDLQLELGVAYWLVRPSHGLPGAAAKTVMDWLLQQA